MQEPAPSADVITDLRQQIRDMDEELKCDCRVQGIVG